jgi:4-carboxymuconolactone decarboxylase
MRLPLIPPSDLTPEQRPLYDAMRKGIASNFNAFKVEREDGALIGPWNPWLHEPAIGKAIWDLTLAMTANATLSDNVRQIAILAVGARFDAAYEIYAHIAVAEREGMKPERLSTLVADSKPNDLAPDESVAFDVAYKLVRGGTLPEPLYRLAVDTFGQHGSRCSRPQANLADFYREMGDLFGVELRPHSRHAASVTVAPTPGAPAYGTIPRARSR